MNTPNQRVYEDGHIVSIYANKTALFAPERTILDKIRPEIAGQPVLDIGVGAGRTTPHLLELTRDYIGVDYAAEMVEYCRPRHPGAQFATCDARNMAAFRDGQFAWVLFSFNGIDYVTPEDRLQVLREIRRVLRPGGLFVFSTHNADKPVHGAFHLSNIEFTPHPVRLVREVIKYFTGWGHHLRNRKQQVTAPDYSIRNDNAHNYRLLTYYIRKPDQVKQLQAHGFTDIRLVDREGAWTDAATPDPRSSWIYFVARKPA